MRTVDGSTVEAPAPARPAAAGDHDLGDGLNPDPASGEPGRWRPRPIQTNVVVLGLLSFILAAVVAGSAGHQRTMMAAGAGVGVLVILLIVCTTRFDVTTVLIAVVLAALLIPARLVYAPLGGAGTPALMLAGLCTWLWVLGVCVPAFGSARGRQPVRTAAIFYLAAVTASYVAASTRGLDPVESRAANRGFLIALASTGLILLTADGVSSRARLDQLVRALVVSAAALAVVGILQFTISLDLSSMVRLPGLSVEADGYSPITTRSSFNRVAGMTDHPIEFSAVLTMILPLALHLSYVSPPGKRRRWWVAVALIGAAVPMSVSRTGSIGLVAVALVLFPTWSGTRRKQMVVAAVVFAVAMKVLVPGLLGTIRGLFLSFGVDPSITARRIDYGFVTRFISERPLFGRGYGTFLPRRYDYLDNQFLLSLVETGAVGLIALVGLFFVAMGCLRGARRRSRDLVTRDLQQSIYAGLVAALLTCGTFDFLSFPTARIVAFVLIGCAGALWRIERARSGPAGSPEPAPAPEMAVAP